MADDSTKGFTFDPDVEGAEVPTLTSLLYKKNLVKAESSDKKPQGSVSPLAATATGIPKLAAAPLPPKKILTATKPVSNPNLTAAPKLRTSADLVPTLTKRPTATPAIPLAPAEVIAVDRTRTIQTDQNIPIAFPSTGGVGDRTLTQVSLSPMERGIEVLRKRNLFRGAAQLQSADGGRTYRFHESMNRPDGDFVWKGIVFDQNDFTDVFSRLAKFGFLECAPHTSAAQNNFERLGFRTGFGTNHQEWLTLILIASRGGPGTILAVISGETIQAHLPFFHAEGATQAA